MKPTTWQRMTNEECITLRQTFTSCIWSWFASVYVHVSASTGATARGNKKQRGWKSCLHKDVEERTRLHSSVTCFTLSMVGFQEGQSEPAVTMSVLVIHNNYKKETNNKLQQLFCNFLKEFFVWPFFSDLLGWKSVHIRVSLSDIISQWWSQTESWSSSGGGLQSGLQMCSHCGQAFNQINRGRLALKLADLSGLH